MPGARPDAASRVSATANPHQPVQIAAPIRRRAHPSRRRGLRSVLHHPHVSPSMADALHPSLAQCALVATALKLLLLPA